MSRFNVGGTSQWLYQLSSGLTSQGVENRLIIGDCPSNEREDLRINEIDHLRLKGLGPKKNPINTLKAFVHLRTAIKDFKPDVINTHTSKAGVLGRIASKTVRGNAVNVHTYHGHVLTGYFSKPLEFAIKSVEKALRSFTDFYLVSGEKVLQDIRQAGIIRGSNVLNIWPAVPDYEKSERDTVRKRLGLSSKQVVVGWLGRKVPIKRIDRILDAASRLPEITFLIAGDGESIRETFPEYFVGGKGANIIELGFSSPKEIWSASDIAILTSDNEAMPISPIEAALASVPVVAIDAGSTREVMIDGETGILCTPDSDSLVTAIKSLASDQESRSTLGAAARKLALSKFSPESSVQRQIVGYQAALNTARS